MKILKQQLTCWCTLACLFASIFTHAEIAVVVGSSSALSSASADELQRVYLGKSKSLGGTAVTPINQTKGATADEFNKALLNKSSSQVKAYWSKLVFTGKGTPPKEVGVDAAVITEVSGNPNAVGYISSTAVTGDVKVLLTL